MTSPFILQTHELTVRYGGVTALNKVSIAVPPQSMYGIIGPNGAGKSTLFNAICSLAMVEEGSKVTFEGRDITSWPVHKIAQLGVARTFQTTALDRDGTVRENIMAGFHLTLGYSPLNCLLPGLGTLRAEMQAQDQLERIAASLGLTDLLDVNVSALSLGLQKKVELARALVAGARLLMLDEPAGGLDDRETASLAEVIRDVYVSTGATILIVDHNVDFIMGLCQRICVLNYGSVLAEGLPEDIRRNPAVIESYLGAAEDAA